MSEDIIRCVSPPGSRHPTPEERMEFIKWYMTDEIQDLYKAKARYKIRKMIIKMYLEEKGIKISEPFLVGLDIGALTRESIDGNDKYYMARKFKKVGEEITQVSLDEYCKNPNILLRYMMNLKK